MTLEERIEAATAALFDYEDAARATAAEQAIRAAFPELFTDPPTAWIAPWEATDEMRDAADLADGGVYDDRASGARHFEVMRDSHLSTLKGEKSDV